MTGSCNYNIIFDKVFIAVLTKYVIYNNIFSVENIIKPSKYFRINNYTIKLKKVSNDFLD